MSSEAMILMSASCAVISLATLYCLLQLVIRRK